jgi:putative Mg2+ transporter-C (MgtC) family protein
VDDLSNTAALQRLGLSLLAGLLLGLEREWQEKPAGLRTYALVCEGAALFMMGSILLGEEVRKAGGTSYDPSRIGSTIVTGIGFLAAGVILTRGGRIRGLTTAADMWVTAAIGLLIGAGFYFLAISATIATILVLVPLKWLESHITPSAAASRNTTEASRSEGADTDPD